MRTNIDRRLRRLEKIHAKSVMIDAERFKRLCEMFREAELRPDKKNLVARVARLREMFDAWRRRKEAEKLLEASPGASQE